MFNENNAYCLRWICFSKHTNIKKKYKEIVNYIWDTLMILILKLLIADIGNCMINTRFATVENTFAVNKRILS